jgi:hypothetical protein
MGNQGRQILLILITKQITPINQVICHKQEKFNHGYCSLLVWDLSVVR